MRRIVWSLSILTAVGAGLAGSGCSEPRPFVGGSDGGGGESLCTTCHGTAGRAGTLPGTDVNLDSSPPAAPSGEPAAVVGAHQAHLNPATGSLRGPLACSECHVVPTDFAHASNPPASPVDFSTSTLAHAGGAAPAWNSTDKVSNTTCSNVYCHGNFNFSGVTGNTNNKPDWTITNPNQAACGSCHGLPPTGHIPLGGTPTAASCNPCHPGTVDPAGNIVVNATTGQSLHINGQKDVGGGGGVCTVCHGTAGRTGTLPGTDVNLAASPPVEPAGEPAAVVGAHQAHLNPAATGSLTGPLACSECHVVPTDFAHASSPPTSPVDFGASTIARTGGAAPTWDSTDKVSNTTCSNVYCHGNFNWSGVTGTTANKPDWTITNPNQAACGTCHDLPPTGHITIPGGVTCSGCHPGTVDSNFNIIVNPTTGKSLHVNGQVDEGAHADPNWSDPTHHGYAANSGGLQACTVCHVGFGPADGKATSSCNACHGGGTAWQSNCTFCHGTAARTGNLPGTDALLVAAPPVGTNGETTTSQAAVGAHLAHANPPATGALSDPIGCATCHPSPLPADVTHVVGGTAPVQFSGLATTGGITTAGYTGGSCSATYCHGNYPQGGNGATPVWTTVDGSFAVCTSCHGAPPASGTNCPDAPSCHAFHITAILRDCSNCHNGIATGSGSTIPVTNAVIVDPTMHVNGVRDVVFGGVFGGTPVTGTWAPAPVAGNAAGGSCNVSCHVGSRNW